MGNLGPVIVITGQPTSQVCGEDKLSREGTVDVTVCSLEVGQDKNVINGPVLFNLPTSK